MKKRGSALVVVLFTLLALVIIGTAVFEYTNNTSKLNKKQIEKDDVQLAAKSILNTGIYSLVEGVQEGEKIDSSYLQKSVKSIINNEVISGISYEINIKGDGFRQYIIDVKASKNGIESEASKNININLYNLKGKIKEVEKFLKMNSAVTILNDNNLYITNLTFGMNNSSFNIAGVINNPRISGATQFKAFIRNKFPTLINNLIGNDIENIENKNYGFNRSRGLNLLFGKRGCHIDRYENAIKSLNLSSRTAYLLDTNGPYKGIDSLGDITYNDLKNSSGIMLKDGKGKYIILLNGNLYIDGYIRNINNTFIYATESINIQSWIEFSHWDLDISNSSMISGDSICIDSSRWLEINNGEFDVDSNLKNILLRFAK